MGLISLLPVALDDMFLIIKRRKEENLAEIIKKKTENGGEIYDQQPKMGIEEEAVEDVKQNSDVQKVNSQGLF